LLAWLGALDHQFTIADGGLDTLVDGDVWDLSVLLEAPQITLGEGSLGKREAKAILGSTRVGVGVDFSCGVGHKLGGFVEDLVPDLRRSSSHQKLTFISVEERKGVLNEGPVVPKDLAEGELVFGHMRKVHRVDVAVELTNRGDLHRGSMLDLQLKKVKLLAILDLVIFTVLDARQPKFNLGVGKAVVAVGIEVEGEGVATHLETVAAVRQNLERLVEDTVVLEDHHVADVAVFHCAASVGPELKKVKPQEEATSASSLVASLI